MAHLLITGHSRGLGAALTHQLLNEGHCVLGISRHPIRDLHQFKSSAFQELCADLGQNAGIASTLESKLFEDFFNNVEQAILINNAGLLGPIGRAGQINGADIIQSIAVNVAAPLALTNRFLAITGRCKDRRIAHLSSGAARTPYPGWNIYCASKAALDHHARCISLEGPEYCRIESIAPGVIDTQMQAEIRACSLEQFPMRQKFDQLKESGSLAPSESVARKLIQHLFSQSFGMSPCTDLREI
jgi:NAD(P)-dependent dehydrogenase (short-subunit alcohol dehydrogenase family)